MPSDNKKFSARDYVALGAAILLAGVVWLVHNLTLSHSDTVHCKFYALCDMEGYAPRSSQPCDMAARCDMSGFSLLYAKITSRAPAEVRISPEDLHGTSQEGLFYMTSADFTRYFHDIFGDQAKVEYFVTDTVKFRFEKVNCKRVPVHAVAQIDFEPQYMATSPLRLSPDSVTVYGSSEQLKATNRVNTKRIDLRSLKGEAFGEVRLEDINGIRISCRTVKYALSVTRYVEFNETLSVTVEGVPRGTNLQVIPSSAKVAIRMPYPSDFDFDGCSVVISYSDFISSISGHCTGRLKGTPQEAITFDIKPEVFECATLR